METLQILAAVVVLTVLVLTPMVIIPRLRMIRHARELQARYPGAEQTSLYLPLHSTTMGQKQREIEAKIAEMQPLGWTFLKASEANLLRTMRTWGGGVNVHFIRTNGKDSYAA
jgi:hypothetical protein